MLKILTLAYNTIRLIIITVFGAWIAVFTLVVGGIGLFVAILGSAVFFYWIF